MKSNYAGYKTIVLINNDGHPRWLSGKESDCQIGLQSLGQEDTLEKEMATPSSILVWIIPWTEEPGGI